MGSYRMNRSGVRSVLAVSLFFISVHLEAAPDESRLWFKQPARDWNEALPVGNGRLAAMFLVKSIWSASSLTKKASGAAKRSTTKTRNPSSISKKSSGSCSTGKILKPSGSRKKICWARRRASGPT